MPTATQTKKNSLLCSIRPSGLSQCLLPEVTEQPITILIVQVIVIEPS